MEITVFYVALSIAIFLDLIVSVFIFKRTDLEGFQKGAQIFIVWLIPYFAAIGLWLFHRSHDAIEIKQAGRNFGGGSGSDNISATSAGD